MKTERGPKRRLGHTHMVYATALRYPTDRLFVVKISQSVTHFRPVSTTLTSVDDLFVSALFTYHSIREPNQRMQQPIQPFAASQTVLRFLVAVLDRLHQLRPPALGYVYMNTVICVDACRYAASIYAKQWQQADRHLHRHQCCHCTTRTCRSMAFGCCAFTSVISGAWANTQHNYSGGDVCMCDARLRGRPICTPLSARCSYRRRTVYLRSVARGEVMNGW